jgi:hypothetical protein
MYSVLTYFLSKVITELPLLVMQPFFFSVIVYWGVGLTHTAVQFFSFYLIIFMVVFASNSYGYFLSSLFDNSVMAA